MDLQFFTSFVGICKNSAQMVVEWRCMWRRAPDRKGRKVSINFIRLERKKVIISLWDTFCRRKKWERKVGRRRENWNWWDLSLYVDGSIFLVWQQHKRVCFAYKGSNPVKAQNQICLCGEFWPTQNERFQYRTFLRSARKWSKRVGHRMSQGGRINLTSFPFKCWNAVL